MPRSGGSRRSRGRSRKRKPVTCGSHRSCSTRPRRSRWQPVRELGGVRIVLEHEHPDASRLAVAADREHRTPSCPGAAPQRRHDAVEVPGGPDAEEGQRDVQVRPRDDSNPGRKLDRALPPLDGADHVVGKTQCAEEAEGLITTDGSGVDSHVFVTVLCQETPDQMKRRHRGAPADRLPVAAKVDVERALTVGARRRGSTRARPASPASRRSGPAIPVTATGRRRLGAARVRRGSWPPPSRPTPRREPPAPLRARRAPSA